MKSQFPSGEGEYPPPQGGGGGTGTYQPEVAVGAEDKIHFAGVQIPQTPILMYQIVVGSKQRQGDEEGQEGKGKGVRKGGNATRSMTHRLTKRGRQSE